MVINPKAVIKLQNFQIFTRESGPFHHQDHGFEALIQPQNIKKEKKQNMT